MPETEGIQRRKISYVVPCLNEVDNVELMAEALIAMSEKELSSYDFDIIFIDNDSQDGTRDVIRLLCAGDPRIRAIFNVRNFGQFNSPYWALTQADGDCAILICCDFQDPIELVPEFVRQWESGYKLVCGIKTTSRENRVLYTLRTFYYKTIRKMSDVDQIEHFTGFGLYDKSFLKTLRDLDDPTPFLRGIVAELGPRRKEIPYEQQLRRSGKTKNNFYSLYDAAMLSFTSYTKVGLRVATFAGFALSFLAIVAAVVYLVLKLMFWNTFPAGSIPVLLAVLVFGSVQLFFIGFLGEYIITINKRVMHRPLVVEDERINFDVESEGPPDDVP